MAMIRTQVYLPNDLHRELKLLAHTRNTNFSQLIREGASLVVKKKVKSKKKFDPWKDFIGKGKKGGPKNLSGKIDYYLYVEPYKNKRGKKK
jgi:hypothetical protein